MAGAVQAPGVSMDITPPMSRTCKYCFTDDNQEDMIWPCKCKQEGYPWFVHRTCLNNWRASCTRQEFFLACRECGYEFRLEEINDTDEGGSFVARRLPDQRQRLRGIIGKSIRYFIFCALGLQVLICLVAMLLRLVDTNEKLVRLWNLSQLEGSPPAGARDLITALRYHKLTYYLSACMLMLACLVFALILGCFFYCEWNECAGRVCCSGYCLASLTLGQALPCCGFVLGMAVVGAVAVIFVGAFGVAVGLVVGLHRTVTGCMLYNEMRRLASWYKVKDRAAGLSPMDLPPHAEPPDEEVEQRLRRQAEFHYNTTHGVEDSTLGVVTNAGALL